MGPPRHSFIDTHFSGEYHCARVTSNTIHHYMKYTRTNDMKSHCHCPIQNTKPLSRVLKALTFLLVSLLMYSIHNYNRGSFSMRWSQGVYGHYTLWLFHSACSNQVTDTSPCVCYKNFNLVKWLLKFSTWIAWYLWVARVSVDGESGSLWMQKPCRYSRAVGTGLNMCPTFHYSPKY